MIRKFKAIGLALVAVFAMSAVAASGAQAEAGTFRWEEGTTTLTPSALEAQKFTTEAGTVECAEVVGSATVSGTSAASVLTSSITYRETSTEPKCKTNFGSLVKATIDMNGCNYRFNAGTTVEADKTEGTADVVCSAGNEIVVTSSFCTIRIPAQTGLGPVYYEATTAASPKDVDINPQIGVGPGSHAISYSESGFCANGTFNNGTYTGKVTIKGETSKGVQKGVWVE